GPAQQRDGLLVMNRVAAAGTDDAVARGDRDTVSQGARQSAAVFPDAVRIVEDENGIMPLLGAAAPGRFSREVSSAVHEKSITAHARERTGETDGIGKRR